MTLPDGSKEPTHDHDWLVTTKVVGDKLDETGVLIDFHLLKAMVDKISSELDNTVLGELEYFRRNNPSAENVAKYIYDKLEPGLPSGVKLQNVRVVEEPGCSATFCR